MSFTLLPFVVVIAGYTGVQMFRDLHRKSYFMLAAGAAVLAVMVFATLAIFSAHANY
ncbi:MAG TPA: hypothetical protein VMU37_08670 [Caulobacteraceae bacterium]|nr:hypothetical protein [Caulobacteraceae bacterium]